MCEEQGDHEYEEEEILIFVEIDGLVATEALDVQTPVKPLFKIMGLDTDTPFMQIGKEYFMGEFTEPLGSTLLFEEGDPPPRSMATPLQYFGKTSKHVCMRRAFLHQKNKDETEPIPRPPYLDQDLLTTLPDKMVAEYLSLDEQEARRKLASSVADIDNTMTTEVTKSQVSTDMTKQRASREVTKQRVSREVMQRQMLAEVMKQRVTTKDDPTPGPSTVADSCVVNEDVTMIDPDQETPVTDKSQLLTEQMDVDDKQT